jgi:hypothetical protein
MVADPCNVPTGPAVPAAVQKIEICRIRNTKKDTSNPTRTNEVDKDWVLRDKTSLGADDGLHVSAGQTIQWTCAEAFSVVFENKADCQPVSPACWLPHFPQTLGIDGGAVNATKDPTGNYYSVSLQYNPLPPKTSDHFQYYILVPALDDDCPGTVTSKSVAYSTFYKLDMVEATLTWSGDRQ